VTVADENLDAFIDMVASSGIEFSHLGETTEEHIHIDGDDFGSSDLYRNHYENAIAERMNK
jgi:hypothetical protein